MSFVTPICEYCGRFHGLIDGRLAGKSQFSSLIAANTNSEFMSKPVVRKRMTASEAMAFTKVSYKETLDYLT